MNVWEVSTGVTDAAPAGLTIKELYDTEHILTQDTGSFLITCLSYYLIQPTKKSGNKYQFCFFILVKHT